MCQVFVFPLCRSTQWTSRELSGSLCTTLCSITSTTHTSCVRTRWDAVMHMYAAASFTALIWWFLLISQRSALQIASLRVQTGDLGQEETVQKCLQNGAWVEGLFDRFGELINQVQQACRWSSLDVVFKREAKEHKVQHKTRECLQLQMAEQKYGGTLSIQPLRDLNQGPVCRLAWKTFRGLQKK